MTLKETFKKEDKKFKGSLSLDWINKDKSLYYEIDESEGRGIKPVWVDKNDIRVSEPRILNFVRAYGAENSENMLIRGDNLLVLRTLIEQFKGRDEKDKIKCIYIDPPYNTGSAFEHYDDNLKHSEWLTMMRDRFILLKRLLRKDGFILVHLDDMEVHYTKILLDEVFGRENFISTIAVLSSTPSGLKTAHRDKTLIKTKDLILFYKNGKNVKINPQYAPQKEWDSHFNFFYDYKTKKLRSLKEVVVSEGIYDESLAIKDYNISDKKFNKFYIENKKSICQTGKSMPEDVREISLKKENMDKIIPYEDKNGEDQFAYNGRRLSFLNSSVHKFKVYSPKDGGLIEKEDISKLICDFWDDINFNNSQNEGGIDFPGSKKPEALLFRILDMTTNENDFVLDSFLGAGTTAVVAHKMKRRWIGIEIGKHAETHCINRLNNVITGKDQDNKKYLGGFKYYRLTGL